MSRILLCLLPPNAPDFPLLGLASLAGALRRAGHAAAVLDANLALHRRHPQEHWRWSGSGWPSWTAPPAAWLEETASLAATTLASGAFDGLALSLGNAGWPFVRPLLRRVRRAFPTLPVLLGGPAFFHEADARRGEAEFDAGICRGEGEQAIADWATALGEPGAGASRGAPPRRALALDSLPMPDFSLFPDGYMRPGVLPLETSRGCVNQCAFCDDRLMWRRYRQKSADRLKRDVAALAGRCTHISCVDSLLNPTPARVLQTAALLGEAHAAGGLTWEAMLECRGVDSRVAESLAAAGCTDVFLGVESFDPAFLRRLGKAAVSAAAPEAIRALSGAGIRVSMGFIVAGPPLQTERQWEEDLRRLLALAPHLSHVAVNPLCLPEGTRLWAERERLGIGMPAANPWGFWHGGDPRGDVLRRFAWCRHVRAALRSAHVDTDQDTPQEEILRRLEDPR